MGEAPHDILDCDPKSLAQWDSVQRKLDELRVYDILYIARSLSITLRNLWASWDCTPAHAPPFKALGMLLGICQLLHPTQMQAVSDKYGFVALTQLFQILLRLVLILAEEPRCLAGQRRDVGVER